MTSNPPKISPLCQYCQTIVSQWPTTFSARLGPLPHHANINLLSKSAEKGCGICTQLLRSSYDGDLDVAKEVMGDEVYSSVATMYSGSDAGTMSEFEGGEDYWVIQLDFFRPEEEVGGTVMKSVEEVKADEDDQDSEEDRSEDGSEPEPIIQFRVDLIPAISSSLPEEQVDSSLGFRPLSMVNQWMETCSKSHKICNPNEEKPTPTRLVSTFDEKPRLCFSSNFKECPKYATLSHCWGKSHFLTLKKDNIQQFQRGIPEEALSKTFKDAIHIARSLGIPYIWIDSICIVQDDPKDWEREASLMSTVYGNSTLNIAAAWARDGTHGIFYPTPLSRTRSKIQGGLTSNPTIYDCAPSELYRRSMSSMPLEFRGWTLQERVLPAKSLYFTQTQVFWECYERVACETFPGGFPKALMYHESSFRKVPVSRRLWAWIVQDYSARDLTFSSDKLVAVSGLARKIQGITGDGYFAGLWREGFELQLLWSRAHWDTGPSEEERSEEYRAPSWSWACLDHPIDWREFPDDGERVFFVEILDINVTLKSPDPFGQISSAMLRMRCQHLLPGTVDTTEDDKYGKVCGAAFPVDVYLDHPNKHGNGQTDDVYFLPITRLLSSGYLRLEGLVLLPSGQIQDNTYKRVGKFSISNEYDCGRFMETALEYAYFQERQEEMIANGDSFIELI